MAERIFVDEGSEAVGIVQSFSFAIPCLDAFRR